MGGERFDFSKGRRRFFSLTFGSCFRDEKKTWMIKTFFEVFGPKGQKTLGAEATTVLPLQSSVHLHHLSRRKT